MSISLLKHDFGHYRMIWVEQVEQVEQLPFYLW